MLRITRQLTSSATDVVRRSWGRQHRGIQGLASASVKNQRGRSNNTSASSGQVDPLAALFALTSATYLGQSSVSCEKERHKESPLIQELFPHDNHKNPLWPGGCREEDVDKFVDQVLEDPSINIPGIPDSVERIIYKSTIRLVLNIFYWLISKVHGFALLDHEIDLQVERMETPLVLGDWNHTGIKVDEEVLQMVADRLLTNSAVNYTLVPDSIERPLYINSLRLVFRLLDILTASFSLKICGHVLLLDLVPLRNDQEDIRNHDLSSSLTRIDLEKVREVARRHAGIIERDRSELSFLDRFSIKEEFLAQLHASIYALVLGIADDVLANAEITLLSDKIILDVVPSTQKKITEQPTKEAPEESTTDRSTNERNAGFHVESFLMGCGVGIASVAAALAAVQGRR